ncbi:MAG: type II secretion system protein GspK [Planctomycetota bacterium]|jgi:type II secretory pathway component PulK
MERGRRGVRCGERGAALLLAVLVLAILIALIGQMIISSAHSRSVAGAAIADLQNTYGAQAGYQHALLYLKADLERGDQKDSLHEPWAAPINVVLPKESGTVVYVQMSDVGSKLNLSLLVKDNGERDEPQVARLARLLLRLGHEGYAAERIADYVDGDSDGEFEAGAKNARLFNLEELLRIEGIPREELYGDEEKDLKGLMEFVTLWPMQEGTDAGKININTAPAEVLACLHDGLTPLIAEEIVAYRSGGKQDGTFNDFEQPNHLVNVEGVGGDLMSMIEPLLSVKSALFEIHVRSVTGAVEKAWLFVVRRSGEGTNRVASMLRNDFLWVKEPEGEEE